MGGTLSGYPFLTVIGSVFPQQLPAMQEPGAFNDGTTRATDVLIVGKRASVCGHGKD